MFYTLLILDFLNLGEFKLRLVAFLLLLILFTKLALIVACRMFYFFFESRNSKKDPVVIWLTGGPGCSSELALFYENGPFTITHNLSLVWNKYGWDKVRLFVLDMSKLIMIVLKKKFL